VSSRAPQKPRPARTRSRGPSTLGHGDLAQSLGWIFPLFVIYGVSILFVPAMNGVDFVSRNLFALVGHSRARYLAVYAVLTGVYLLILWRGRSYAWGKRVRHDHFLPMFLEAAIYALTLGSFILFVMRNLFGIGPTLAVAGQAPAPVPVDSLWGQAVLSLGAGVHEELVFRLGLFSGGALVLRALLRSHKAGVITALVLSSLLFAIAHHIGPAGDPWTLQIVVYRTLAGAAFATIYYYRSLAHACYAHALYDIYVLILK